MKILNENYDLCFGSETEAAETFKKLDETDRWIDFTTKDVTAIPIENLPIFLDKIRKDAKISDTISDDSIFETMESGISLGVRFPLDGEYTCIPVGVTGYLSLLQRAGYQNANALYLTESKKEFNPMAPDKKSIVINYGFETQGSKPVKALIRDEKVRYLASGEYQKLPFSLLMSAFKEGLENEFEEVCFAGSSASHEYMHVLYKIRDSFLEATMKEILAKALIFKPFTFGVRLTSSDVGLSGANIYPFLILDGKCKAIGKPICLEHKGNHTVDDFIQNVNKSFSLIRDGEMALKDLGDEKIKNPGGAFRRVAKSVGLPKKSALDASYRFEKLFANPTFLDLYFQIYEVFDDYVESYKISQSTQMLLEENIARLLFSKRSDYDAPFEWA